jgi:SlyX protein
MTEKRLIDLEIRFSHQDDFLMKLNEVVTQQGIIIQRLEKEILDLKRTANDGASVEGFRSLRDDKPPHY